MKIKKIKRKLIKMTNNKRDGEGWLLCIISLGIL